MLRNDNGDKHNRKIKQTEAPYDTTIVMCEDLPKRLLYR